MKPGASQQRHEST